jgi:proteasome assembly chaperone (PAC2) family protein
MRKSGIIFSRTLRGDYGIEREEDGDETDEELTMDDSAIRLDREPELHRPSLYAAWPGMGNVSLNVAKYMVENLEMEPVGSIESTESSVADGIVIRDHLVLPLETPEYRFYAFRHPDGGRDLLLFVADHQPLQPQAVALARLVMRVANRFAVQRVYTSAALMCSISHMERPRVWGVATHRELLPELEASGVPLLPEGHVSGLNGLLLGVGQRMGVEGLCFLGELPYYTIGMDNPKSSLVVLERLCRLWRIRLDTSDLLEASLKKEIEIEEFIRQGEKSIPSDAWKDKGAGTQQYN